MPASVWRGYISFGLVSFPVRLAAAARPETVHFHMLHEKDLSRVKEVFFCAEEERPLERSEIVKGYEYEKGKYVVISPDDLERIAPSTARVMEIQQFVKQDEIDPIFLEKSYYVTPDEEVSKPYALLTEAMRLTGFDAIAKVAMHSREHVVVLRATPGGLILHTLYFTDELHEANKITIDQKAFDRRELDLAQKLIKGLAGPFEPKQYHDEYRENVLKMIAQKQKGKKITAVPQKKSAPVVNIMQALQKSLGEMTNKSSAPSKPAGAKAVGKPSARKSATKRGAA